MRHDTIHWLYAVPGKKKGYIVVLILVQALLGASGVFYALLLRNIVDAAAGKDPKGFWYNVLLTLLLVGVQIGLRAMIRWINELTAATFENRFKSRLMHTLLQKDYATVCAIHSGEWLNRLTNDTVVVAKGYVEIVPGLAGMAVKMLSAFCMLIALDLHFAAILIPGGVLLVVLTWLFRKVLKRLHKAVQETDGNLRIFLQECMGSMLMLRSFAAEEQTAQRAEEKMEAHLRARMSKNRFSNLCNIGFGSAMNGMYLFGVIYCGYGILTGTVSFGTLTAITQLIAQIQVPFANITGYLPRFYAMLASAERLMEMEAFSEDEEKALPRDAILDFYTHRLRALGLRDATFRYYPIVERLDDLTKEDMPPALDGLSLEVRKGQYIALTGHSGCGKSTVLKVLMCVYGLDGGARYLADADGNTVELNGQWRRLFAYVPQGNQLMSGTIREIISFPEPEAAWDEDRLSYALKVACAGEFVRDLERGVDTLLGERGTGLSEGQMQRVAIARAVFSKSPILLLDEATSALDALTEKRLLQNLRSMTDKTVLIVTHRREALEICDRVLRFTENGVEEQ